MPDFTPCIGPVGNATAVGGKLKVGVVRRYFPQRHYSASPAIQSVWAAFPMVLIIERPCVHRQWILRFLTTGTLGKLQIGTDAIHLRLKNAAGWKGLQVPERAFRIAERVSQDGPINIVVPRHFLVLVHFPGILHALVVVSTQLGILLKLVEKIKIADQVIGVVIVISGFAHD